MNHTIRRILPALLAVAVGILCLATAGAPHEGPPSVEKQRGVNWVGGREPVSEAHLRPLVEYHVGWIAQTPFGWQQSFDSTEIQLITEGRILWGETDEGLITTTRLAHKLGIKTLLKPHIWLRDRSGGKWRTDIRMASEEAWQQWFSSYRRFILHYAQLAEANGIEALAIGTELHTTVVEREKDWRQLIAEIRKVYKGQLTYSANWWKEFEEVPFWDALDCIGVQGYFPLTDQEKPTLEQLKEGWKPHTEALEAVSRRFGKSVIFTEIGYKSTGDAAIRPWEWPEIHDLKDLPPVNLEFQARCYEAFFQTFWDRPWVAGAYFWKWYPTVGESKKADNIDFTPQGKPAGEVLKGWYSR